MKSICLLCIASAASAQVSVRGLAYDSLHGKPLVGAFIGVVGLKLGAISDSTGRFVLLGVPRGAHRLVMQHDVLDAVGLSAAGARAVIDGDRDSVVVAVPSFATLWRAACGTQPPGADTGFMFGTVRRASQPAPVATVTASWVDLYIDSTKAARQKQKLMEADADSSGNFALCGLPTTTELSVRASVNKSYGAWIDVPPLDKERIARRDLNIVASSPMRFDIPQRTTFTGRVRRDSTELPLADAEVMIANIGLSGTTNARGEFRIAGVGPGTHTVRVRKVGFSFTEQRVEFGADPVDRTFVMSRITTLDSVTVTSSYSPNDEALRVFEENRKLGLGKFFTREDLERFRDRRMSDILGQLPGTKAQVGSGGQGWILSSRGNKSISIGPTGASSACDPPKQDHPDAARFRGPPCSNACYPRVFVDGIDASPTEVPNINRFTPYQIEALEYYAGGAQVPPEYSRLNKSACGVIVIHTRRGK